MSAQKPTNLEFLDLPSAKEFCLSVPLYESYQYDNKRDNPFFDLEILKERWISIVLNASNIASLLCKKIVTEQIPTTPTTFSLWAFYAQETTLIKPFSYLALIRAHYKKLDRIHPLPISPFLIFANIAKYSEMKGSKS